MLAVLIGGQRKLSSTSLAAADPSRRPLHAEAHKCNTRPTTADMHPLKHWLVQYGRPEDRIKQSDCATQTRSTIASSNAAEVAQAAEAIVSHACTTSGRLADNLA